MITGSEAVRQELVRTLRRDLIGPYPTEDDADLAEECLAEEPSRWYLTAYLAPTAGSPRARREDESPQLDALEAEDLEAEERDITVEAGTGEDEGSPDESNSRRRRRPASLSLAAALAAATRRIEAVVTWGDYCAEPPIPRAILDGTGSKEEWSRCDAASGSGCRGGAA